jgi:hypothetical protein
METTEQPMEAPAPEHHEPEATETIILHAPAGVHTGAFETHTVRHNGKEYVLRYGVPTPVPQCVIDVLNDSHMVWSQVERAPDPDAEPKAIVEPEDEETSSGKKNEEDEE